MERQSGLYQKYERKALMAEKEENETGRIVSIPGLFKNWFLDYASYVILERAVPELADGLKPVQRRILHSMRELDDGRYNKVANVVGNTMKYHPHGDASIGDALVQLGQKELLIDCQGNWGNILTGDPAAAPRYIEARLSRFALAVVFNPKTTEWKPSYDGRNQEPVALPIKFPLLLFQGVEGIAVGLASKVLPHNFIELIDASIKILKGQDFEIYPDFPTGGSIDVTNYNDGLRGGKIRVRAKIGQIDKKTLVIQEIPFGTTTSSLIESILKADEKGKIKIRKVEDNTAEKVEILIHLQPGVSPDQTIDALYAFTDCEVSISPNACVVSEQKPRFLGVSEILRISTENTMQLLTKELEIRFSELQAEWYFTSLEKIFFEERIYRLLEKETRKWEEQLAAIRSAFRPFEKKLGREVSEEDVMRLVEKPVRKISRFDIKKADEKLSGIESEMEEVKDHLAHLVDYTVAYFQNIRKEYGKDRERKTEIRNFENIQASMVAATNEKLYVNRTEGFIGTGLKKDEYVCECSDIDDIIVFRRNGVFKVVKAGEKIFVGEDILHVGVFKRNDERTIYNMVYSDGKDGIAYAKRFSVGGITRDKDYDLTKGTAGSQVLYFSANPNGEAEVVAVSLRFKPKLKKLSFEFDFKTLAVKGRGSMGNILSRNAVKRIELKTAGVSTLGARKIWYDDTVKRLNVEERGQYVGQFKGQDRILTLMETGAYKLMSFDLGNHFDEDMIRITKHYPERVVTAVYQDKKTKLWYIKRFMVEDSDKRQPFIDEETSLFISLSLDACPQLKVVFDTRANKKEVADMIVDPVEFIGVKGFKAKGKRLSNYYIKKVEWLEALQPDPDYERLQGERDAAEMPESAGLDVEADPNEQLSLF
ncbi:MAG: DNA gyrase/topoisomerase IV subunit A [Bacteroidales bacterium]|nr:DNA gyrase/topoisomerase IV subunit A [Bacteroidales bacterium]